jgi:hypothetical protein
MARLWLFKTNSKLALRSLIKTIILGSLALKLEFLETRSNSIIICMTAIDWSSLSVEGEHQKWYQIKIMQ